MCSSGSGLIIDGMAIWDWSTDDHRLFFVKDPLTPEYQCAKPWQADQQWLGHARLTCQ